MKLNYFTNFVLEKMTHLDKESPNFLIRLPLKENLLSILKAQIHTFLNTTIAIYRDCRTKPVELSLSRCRRAKP